MLTIQEEHPLQVVSIHRNLVRIRHGLNFVSEKSGKRCEKSGKYWIKSGNREILRWSIFFPVSAPVRI